MKDDPTLVADLRKWSEGGRLSLIQARDLIDRASAALSSLRALEGEKEDPRNPNYVPPTDPIPALLERIAVALENASGNPDVQKMQIGAEGEWRPIETAPKDGTFVLGVVGSFMAVCHWSVSRNCFVWFDDGSGTGYAMHPTHWTPLPTLPDVP